MTEKADEAKDTAKPLEVQASPDLEQRGSVIRDLNGQADWRTTQLAHLLEQDESATDLFYKPGQARQPKQKLEFFDSASEESLTTEAKDEGKLSRIAASLVSNEPKLEFVGQAPPVNGEPTEPKIAQAFDGNMPPPTLMPSFIIQAGIEVWESSNKPLEGSEMKALGSTKSANPRAWEDAAAAFPQLQGVSVNIMKAYTLNETHHYDRHDWLDDLAAANGKLIDIPLRKAEDATLGLSQISPKGVHTFEDRYPQLKKFLESNGYSGPGHEANALLDPDCVAMIVAAKTASLVEDMRKQGIMHPSNEQLAYAYNPDVYSYLENGSKKYRALYQGEVYTSKLQHWEQKKEYYANNPEVIAASKHIKNVLKCLKQL